MLVIQGELTDLNTYIKALNSSRWSGNSIKQSETNRVYLEAKRQKIAPIDEYPVQVKFTWFLKDRKKDIDNVSFSKKFCMDGLVLAGVLENDSQKFVAGFQDIFHIDKENPRVEIEILSTGMIL